MKTIHLAALAAALCALAFAADAGAGPFRDRLARSVRAETALSEAVVWKDVAFGGAEAQRLDVYAPPKAKGAPIIVMIHGGGWRVGDKAMAPVFANKAAHYVPRGYVFVSINYRMIPEADPVEQARDVARAVAFIQSKAADWGGDPAKVVLMGHSAGAHLASLVNADPAFAQEAGAQSWLGVVSLDSGAYDVERIMTHRHAGLFDEAFGRDKKFWRSVSPIKRISGNPAPMLLVCSSRRADSCDQAEAFKAALAKVKSSASVLPVDKSHREINMDLGMKGAYTDKVDAFLNKLGLP